MNKLSRILLLTASVFLIACSSDDSEVFDELLSNTQWQQSYIKSTMSRLEEESLDVREILGRLLSETQTAQETDTINKTITPTGKFLLSFGADEKCQLEHVRISEITYQLETYEVEITYYPNQTFREEFEDGTTREIVVYNDTITLRTQYSWGNILEDKIFLEKNNTLTLKGNTLNVSETKVDTIEEVENILMTYKRNGSRIELSGEMSLTGIINDDGTEIELDEIGTLYRQCMELISYQKEWLVLSSKNPTLKQPDVENIKNDRK